MRNIIMAALTTICGTMVLGQTNFYTNVTNLWYQGSKSNVLEIANARLAQNTNDIAGLILKAEFHFAYLDTAEISNAYSRVLAVGETVTSTNFVLRFSIEKKYILDILEDLKDDPITPEELLLDKPKAAIIHKPLPTGLIEALQKDNYFN